MRECFEYGASTFLFLFVYLFLFLSCLFLSVQFHEFFLKFLGTPKNVLFSRTILNLYIHKTSFSASKLAARVSLKYFLADRHLCQYFLHNQYHRFQGKICLNAVISPPKSMHLLYLCIAFMSTFVNFADTNASCGS